MDRIDIVYVFGAGSVQGAWDRSGVRAAIVSVAGELGAETTNRDVFHVRRTVEPEIGVVGERLVSTVPELEDLSVDESHPLEIDTGHSPSFRVLGHGRHRPAVVAIGGIDDQQR